MSFDHYAAAELKAGKTVPLVLNMLPRSKVNGEPPIVHLEHLGETNVSYWNDTIARANAKHSVGDDDAKLSAKKIKESRKKNRATLAKHAVRRLENVFHGDGKEATAADIPEFMDKIPDDVVDKILAFARNEDLYRDQAIESDPRDLAEKS